MNIGPNEEKDVRCGQFWSSHLCNEETNWEEEGVVSSKHFMYPNRGTENGVEGVATSNSLIY
jgi:hypothetical protein